MQSKALTVDAYLKELDADRRSAIAAVRAVILENMAEGFVERMSYGMIGYAVPHSIYPAGYHCDPSMPLPFAGLASQKGHLSLYLMPVYLGGEGGKESPDLTAFRRDWAKSGKKLDMGKSCIRFKTIEDLDLNAVGAAVRRVSVQKFIAMYEALLTPAQKDKAARAAAKYAAGAGENAEPAGAKVKAAAVKKVAKKVVKKAAKKVVKKSGR